MDKQKSTNTETKHVVYLPSSLKQKLESKAQSLGLSVSSYLRSLIIQAVEKK